MGIYQNLGQKPQTNGVPTFDQAMRDLRAHPAELIKQAGYDVPPEIAGDPRQAALHIIRSGQASNPVLQRIQPLMQRLGLRV